MRYIGSILITIIAVSLSVSVQGQCASYIDEQLSPKIASYQITARLDDSTKTLAAHQTVTWTNTSPDTIRELRLYMYMNAFSGQEASFIKWQNGHVFGQSLSSYSDNEWGSITIESIQDDQQTELVNNYRYVRDLDQNEKDQSIISYQLAEPILPGETQIFDMDFDVKMPKIIARAGYSLNSYYLFVHWFPQVCVYEQAPDGQWGWNSHQFVPGTEFYADFGNYHVSLDLPAEMQVGATGCLTHHLVADDRQVVTYQAYDVIDFAWAAYPRFDSYHTTWGKVDLHLLLPPEHCAQSDRMLTAAKQALDYLDEHVGPYPYPKLTIVGPPLHALRSGLMEYPMLITCGSGYGVPEQVRTIESLVVHELTHQYFMAVLATNEKEEAWMDEGFVTYYEDRIIDHYYGNREGLYNLWGYQSGNAQHTRSEYLGMDDLESSSIGRPGWEFNFENYKELIYAKTATTFKTLAAMMGKDHWDDMMRAYYDRYKFTHPRGKDFIDFVENYLSKHSGTLDSKIGRQFLQDAIYDASYLDYAVTDVTSSTEGYTIKVERLGSMQVPTDIRLTFGDGSREDLSWDGNTPSKTIRIDTDKKLLSVVIDPDQKLYLDANLINNSYTSEIAHKPLVKYSGKVMQWMQYVLHLTSIGL